MIYIVRVKTIADDSVYANAYNSLEEAQRAVRKIKEGLHGSKLIVDGYIIIL